MRDVLPGPPVATGGGAMARVARSVASRHEPDNQTHDGTDYQAGKTVGVGTDERAKHQAEPGHRRFPCLA